jgi:hypothetical protein
MARSVWSAGACSRFLADRAPFHLKSAGKPDALHTLRDESWPLGIFPPLHHSISPSLRLSVALVKLRISFQVRPWLRFGNRADCRGSALVL